MYAADLRALWTPSPVLVALDVERIYSMIVKEATIGKIFADFEISIDLSLPVIRQLQPMFPDVRIIELETHGNHRFYRAMWGINQSDRPQINRLK